jgi:hypothetical protein
VRNSKVSVGISLFPNWLSAVWVLIVAFEGRVQVSGAWKARNSKFFADLSVCIMWLRAVWVLMIAFEAPVTVPGGMADASCIFLRVHQYV